jgi:hypothetical protein
MGLVFGLGNMAHSLLFPLADDTIPALLAFYGPMFSLCAASSFLVARSSGRWVAGVRAGAAVAFVTFLLFTLAVIMRVNVFLYELTARSDWQNLMRRFDASGFDSLRTFVTLEYIKGSPLKIGAGTLIGAAMGCVGGALAMMAKQLRVAPS